MRLPLRQNCPKYCFTGSDAITAILRASGFSLLTSVSTGAFFFDALDKGLTSAIAYALFIRTPTWLTRDVS